MSRTNEKRTTIQEHENTNVCVSYFWAEGEELNHVNDSVNLPVGWLHAKVRVDLLEFTENFESLCKTMDFKTLQLYIEDEYIGELVDIKEENTEHGTILKCKVLVGAG